MATYKREGNVFKLTAYSGYSGKNGSQVRKKKTWKPAPELLRNKAKLEKELQKQLVELQELCDRDTLANGKIKFAAFIDQWREDYAVRKLKPSTILFYDTALLRIMPTLGHLRLEEINRRHIANLYRDLESETKQGIKYKFTADFTSHLKNKGITRSKLAELSGVSLETLGRLSKGHNINRITYEKLIDHLGKEFFEAVNEGELLSPNTALHFHKVLSALFEKAKYWGYMNENPCDTVEHPRAQSEEAPFLDDNHPRSKTNSPVNRCPLP